MKEDESEFNKEINAFVQKWDVYSLIEFVGLAEKLIELYDMDEKDDFLRQYYGKEDGDNIRIVRTVMILSKMSEVFGAKMVSTNVKFKGLWKKLSESKEKKK